MSTFGLDVLLIEDDKIIQKITSKILQKLDCQVHIASNGKEGVKQALARPCDLILMDVMMPIMDGFEAAEIILKEKGNDCPPIVIATAYDVPDTRRRFEELGLHEFAIKPLTYEKLQDIFNRLA